jgi:ACT domain-containing protein
MTEMSHKTPQSQWYVVAITKERWFFPMRAIVSVIGKDKVGIIASVCQLLSKYQVNVLDISQTILEDYFTMIMIVDASKATVPFAEFVEVLEQEGKKMDLSIHAQREEIFNAMHRI